MSSVARSSLRPIQLLAALTLALGLVACSERGASGGGGGSSDPEDETGDDDSESGDDDSNPNDGGQEEAYGPDNDWSHSEEAEVPTDLVGTGWRTGDVAHDFTLTDQNGDLVQLYQFYGKVIVLDVYAQWCGPCQENAPHGQDLWEEGNGDVIMLAATQQDYDGNPPDDADLDAWVNTYSLTHPVLADPEMTQNEFVVTGYPTYVVIDQEMRVENDDLWPFDGDYVMALVD